MYINHFLLINCVNNCDEVRWEAPGATKGTSFCVDGVLPANNPGGGGVDVLTRSPVLIMFS